MRKEFRTLLSLDDALAAVLDHLPRIELVSLPLEDAFGRILGERVQSRVDVPGFDRAAMDGYAVRSTDTLEAREDRAVALKLAGQVPMGRAPDVVVDVSQAAEVSTGSMMPTGANAVVMVEHSEVEHGALLIRRPVHVGENVHRADGDIAFGESVLAPGVRLTAREIGVLAAVGRQQVTVRNLAVGVASTGNELSPPGRVLKPGRIYDINSYTIAAAARECGGCPIIYGILPDDYDEMAKGLRKMAESCGLVLVSGSTSAGIGDVIYRVLDDIGETFFHGINLKPGKPTIFGAIDSKPFFGLPGYPTSALTVFGQLVAPMIRKAMGTMRHNHSHSPKAMGRLAKPVRSEGRRQMYSVGLAGDRVYSLDKGSGSITSLSQADGVIEIPDDVEYLDRGENVEVRLFGDYSPPELLVTGEDCPALDILAELLPIPTRFVFSGTRRGVISVEDGVADLAAVSGIGQIRSGCLVKGYIRELVMMSRDPDLLTLDKLQDGQMMGWAQESEMSCVLAKVLSEKGAEEIRLAGRARTHSAVAASVAAGRVDVGLAVRPVAERANLEFVKVAEDRIDFLVGPEEREPVRTFVETLKSNVFRSRLPAGMRLQPGARW
ncbi:MAG: molybdopterin biosynthesis protein [Methanothrix sp.]|nr:MAG: molybdopterin biosynthesis protein [Methanothrix sp.]